MEAGSQQKRPASTRKRMLVPVSLGPAVSARDRAFAKTSKFDGHCQEESGTEACRVSRDHTSP